MFKLVTQLPKFTDIEAWSHLPNNCKTSFEALITGLKNESLIIQVPVEITRNKTGKKLLKAIDFVII